MDEPQGPIPEGPAPPSSPTKKATPLLIVVALVAVAFVAAFFLFRGRSSDSGQDVTAQGAGCADGTADPGYTVAMESEPNPPQVEGTTFHLSVRHDGKAVSGAKVCVTADMTEMHHAGINSVAKEASGGTYDTKLKFGMRGPYRASVVITEKGKAAVVVPLTFDVE